MKNLQKELLDFACTLPIIDVHEHIVRDEMRLKIYPDYIALSIANYMRTAVISSGVPEDTVAFLQGCAPVKEKHPVFLTATKNIRNTYIFKAMDAAFTHIYGISLLDSDYERINAIYAAANKLGITQKIAEACNIKAAVNDVFIPGMQECDYTMGCDVLKSSARCDRFIMVQTYLEDVQAECGAKLPTLSDFIAQWRAYIKTQVEQHGAVAIKIGTAYERSLHFCDTPFEQANAIYAEIYAAAQKGESLPAEKITPLEDFMAHQILQDVQQYKLIVQIHTGIHEGNDNFLQDSHPLLLNNLFSKFKNVKFDIFHIAYPFAREVGVLVRTFPNVYTNFSWAYIIAPEYANDILEEYIGILPANKFSVFGGDFMHIEGSVGQLIILRQFVTKRLAQMVEQEKITTEDAKEILQNIFHKNGAELYGV